MPKIKKIDEVVGAPVLAAAWCISKGAAWSPAGQVAGVAGALAAEAIKRRSLSKDDAPPSAAPQGNVVVAVTDSEVVTTTFSNTLGIKAKEVNGRLPRARVVGADLEGKKIIKTLTLHLDDGSTWAFDCRTVSHKDAAQVVAALGF